MPATSEKQRRFMAMCAHEPGEANAKCPPQNVAKEFSRKDDGSLNIETEMDAAKAMALGLLPSPTKFGNVHLFAMRITGTGTAYRSKDEEFVYRPPDEYLNDEFMQRCNGLPVIFMHPEKSATLNSKEFASRIVGVIMLPYLIEAEREVWGIARIYDDQAIDLMKSQQLSTSPAVVFRKIVDSDFIELHDGKRLLIEGKPALLDHLAICETGVWDKMGEPTGILLNGGAMTPEEEAKAKADAEAKSKADADEKAKLDGNDKLDKILAMADGLSKRFDSLESRMDSIEKTKSDSELSEEDRKKKEAEAEEKTKSDAEAEKNAKAKADAEEVKKRLETLESEIPKKDSDGDFSEMADAQAKADSVFSGFGKSAPAPLRGESTLNYRKRLANGLKALGEKFKTLDLSPIPAGEAFDVLEGQIYADAQVAAANPIIPQEEGLREIIKTDRAGRKISEFKGSISSFTSEFRSSANVARFSSNKGAN